MSAIILWRHAPTASNVADRLQGTLDIPLDEAGRARASWAATRIADTYGPDLRIYSSPLSRATATAAVLAGIVGTEVTEDANLNQRSYGVWQGLTRDEVRARWPEEYERREQGLDPRIPGWDGQDAVATRVAATVERLWDPERPSVLVTHGSPITLGLLALMDVPASSRMLGRVPHAAWAVVKKVESGAWHLEAFALGAD